MKGRIFLVTSRAPCPHLAPKAQWVHFLFVRMSPGIRLSSQLIVTAVKSVWIGSIGESLGKDSLRWDRGPAWGFGPRAWSLDRGWRFPGAQSPPWLSLSRSLLTIVGAGTRQCRKGNIFRGWMCVWLKLSRRCEVWGCVMVNTLQKVACDMEFAAA